MLKSCPTCAAINCTTHKTQRTGAWAHGSTRAWRKTRARVLHRDNHRCHWCGDHATHADHLIPRSHGGPDTPDNLVAACAACNLSRGATAPAREVGS